MAECFRSLKLVRRYGVANLRNLIGSHVNMAERFEGLVARDERFEVVVVVPRNFAMVCLRLLPPLGGLSAGDSGLEIARFSDRN
ncbi:unnamed protein product [Musa acuminata var. zebrina]